MARSYHLLCIAFFMLGVLFLMGIACSSEETKEEPDQAATQESPQIKDGGTKEGIPGNQAPAPDKGAPSGESEITKKGVQPAAETTDYPAEIVLASPLWKKHTKEPVNLTHKKHIKDYGVSCIECHHVFKEGKNIWKPGMPVNKCHECHDEPTIKGEKGLPPGSKMRNLKLAFHKNCQGCHRNLKAENQDSKAPTTCSKCHVKQGE
jgi:hypothetical protein